jgi:hypothetical protein
MLFMWRAVGYTHSGYKRKEVIRELQIRHVREFTEECGRNLERTHSQDEL